MGNFYEFRGFVAVHIHYIHLLINLMILLGIPGYNTSDVAAGLGYNTKQLPYRYSAYMHMELARLG